MSTPTKASTDISGQLLNQQNQEQLKRLERLEGYLREDPSNADLLAEAFEVALQCGQWQRAEFHLRHGQALQKSILRWSLREVDFLLAQGQLEPASTLLKSLQARAGVPQEFLDAVLHNLAWIDFQTGNYQACIDQLAARLNERHSILPAVSDALACLWLRALHHAGQLEQATAWAVRVNERGQLSAKAAGIASLAALDADKLVLAADWARLALQSATDADRPIEALVTLSSLALGQQDADRARRCADAALKINPVDGRACSARAMADLLSGDLTTALGYFERALITMPTHIGTWHGKAWAQLLNADPEGAKRSFESALALDHNFAESHGGLAVVQAMHGDRVKAKESARRAKFLDPGNLSGRYAQSIIDGELSDLAGFQTMAQRLLRGKNAILKAVMSRVPDRK